MNLSNLFLGCLTIIELANSLIRIVKLSPTLNIDPPLTDEMRKRLYS